MVWWCGCCRSPNDTPYGDGKLIVTYDKNPRKFKVNEPDPPVIEIHPVVAEEVSAARAAESAAKPRRRIERVIPRTAHPSRNGRCPCGSGQKFKKCCRTS